MKFEHGVPCTVCGAVRSGRGGGAWRRPPAVIVGFAEDMA